jgi:hypothetical protein
LYDSLIINLRIFFQRAAQIRERPFTGNSSSDSSDDDGSHVVQAKRSSGQPVKPQSAEKCGDSVFRNERFSQRSQSQSQSVKAEKQPPSHEGSYSSLASETSSDYAFPPEDGCSIRTESSDTGLLTKSMSEECNQAPAKKVRVRLKTCTLARGFDF